MKWLLILALFVMLMGCSTIGRYTGNESFYTDEKGTLHSCRDLNDDRSDGNEVCKPYHQWDRPSLTGFTTEDKWKNLRL